MATLLRIFLTGLFISFLGSLPLGTINIAAMQIAISDGVFPAVQFVVGALIAEVAYVRLSLIAMDWVRRQHRLFRILEWATLVIVVALAVSSFYAALHPTEQKNVILSSSLPRFFLGMLMSALNPMQIPFWFGWSTVLFTKKILQPIASQYNSYTLGIGVGTLLGNCVFIFGGLLIAERFTSNQHLVNWLVGGIFTITALVQLWRMGTKKDVQHRMEHPEQETKGFEKNVEGIGKRH